MGKDTTAFRNRFEAYKNGKSVSEIYDAGLPKYGDGKFSIDAIMPYILAIENPTRHGLVNGVWRPATDSTKWDVHAMGGGLDIREENNPIVYNYLKSKGRLNDPYLTVAEEEMLRRQTFEKTTIPALSKMHNKYGDKISEKGYARLAGMKWQGHPYLMVNTPDSITGRAFLNAIASGDRDLDTVFDAYYKYPANAKRYGARIAADLNYWKNNTLGSTQRPKSELVQQLESQKQFQPWENYHGPDYPLNNPAPESISSWNSPKSPAYAYPQLLARSSRSKINSALLNMLMDDEDTNSMQWGFQDGKQPEIKQGPDNIPIDDVEDWTYSKSNGNAYADYWKDRLRGPVKTAKSIVRPYRNVSNRRGTKQDIINIASDFLGGAIVKAVNKAMRAIKPIVTSLKGKTPREVGQYFENHPELTTDVDPAKVRQAREFIIQDALPRVQKEFAKKGKNVSYEPTTVYKQADFMDSNLGGVSTPNGVVYMRNDPKIQYLVHEESHEMRRKTGETAEEASRLFSTYANSPEFLRNHPEYNALKEYEAINTELRYLISYANGGVKGKQLDAIIDNMPYDMFERYAILANAYTKDAAKNKLINPKTWKNTQKTVGMANPRDTQGFLKAKDGKLPGYKDGKIIINPANRGKFNATKKRTGKTTEELTHSKNPLTRKRAIFAQNAKKWNHK